MTDTTTASPPLSPRQKCAKRIADFIRIRDRIQEIEDRHKAELAPLLELKDQVAGWLQDFMDNAGAASIKTEAGTCHFNNRASATVADPSAFMNYVIENHQFDLLDRRANAPAVRDFVKQNGTLPPGVNLSNVRTVGVRRPADK